jgi:hypothetical protein
MQTRSLERWFSIILIHRTVQSRLDVLLATEWQMSWPESKTFKARKCCFCCGKFATVELSDEQHEQYRKWVASGERDFVQDALPSWSAGMRELLITGTHEECWGRMFAEDKDE